MNEWDTEFDLTAVAAGLLAGCPLVPYANGWDKTILRDEDSRLFAFCRRAVAVAGMQRELDVLPRIAAVLPVPVPMPRAEGTFSDQAWPWWSMGHLSGSELALSRAEDRVQLAREVGQFLRQLHQLPPPVELPVDPMNRSDAVRRATMTRERLERLGVDPPGCLRTTLGPSLHAPVFSHGDLHLRHVLVDENGRCSGIIDWGDVCLADRCVDLSVAYSGFDGAARAALIDEYGGLDGEAEERSRVLAAFLCTALAEHATATGNDGLLEGCLDGLRRTDS